MLKTKSKVFTIIVILSIIWGSSFILIKKGLINLTPMEVGSLRIIITTSALCLVFFRNFKKIKSRHFLPLLYTAILGSFFPSYLFAIVETEIDSGVASILNSLTPIFTMLIAWKFFKTKILSNQIKGVGLSLIGMLILVIFTTTPTSNYNYFYSFLVIGANVGYAININIVKKHLHDLDPATIVLGNFSLIVIPAFVVLLRTDLANRIHLPAVQESIGYVVILAIVGTFFAKIIFNKLIKLSSSVSASTVTYTIPIVAIFWGVLDGEVLNISQIISGVLLLIGVFIVNFKKDN